MPMNPYSYVDQFQDMVGWGHEDLRAGVSCHGSP